MKVSDVEPERFDTALEQQYSWGEHTAWSTSWEGGLAMALNSPHTSSRDLLES